MQQKRSKGLDNYDELCGSIIEKVKFLLTFKPAVMEAANVRSSKVCLQICCSLMNDANMFIRTCGILEKRIQ